MEFLTASPEVCRRRSNKVLTHYFVLYFLTREREREWVSLQSLVFGERRYLEALKLTPHCVFETGHCS